MKLRQMRESLGLTQVEIAKLLKVRGGQVTWSRWETGAMAIQQPEILRMAMEHLRCKAKK